MSADALHRHAITALLLIVAVIHLLPLSGVWGGARLQILYGLTISDPSLELLMRHRAVLFGMLGVLLVHAAFKPHYRELSMLAAALSVLSFLLLTWLTPGYNAALRTVVWADWIALACLAAAALLQRSAPLVK